MSSADERSRSVAAHNRRVFEQDELAGIARMNATNALIVPVTGNSVPPAPVAEEAEVDDRLSRLGAKAGKHGPLAAVKVPIPLKLQRGVAIKAQLLSRSLGMCRATWVAQLVSVAVTIPADRWFAALADMQKHGRD